MSGDNELAEWVRKEMTVDAPSVLMGARDRVSRLLGVTADAVVVFKLSSEQRAKLNARDQILLYATGKTYAHAAGYCPEDSISNAELVAHLGMPDGTVKSQLKALRDAHLLNSPREGVHTIPVNRMLEALSIIEGKVA
jgi:DNA-binding transcriptional ArsR family regulator